jgi:hypothetical protein
MLAQGCDAAPLTPSPSPARGEGRNAIKERERENAVRSILPPMRERGRG